MSMRRSTALVLSLTLAAALLAGCARDPGAASSAPPPDQSGEEAQAGPSVQADWSKLPEKAAPVQADQDGGRWYPEYTDHLIPGENYGPLVPYVGACMYRFDQWTNDAGEEENWYDSWPTPLYGLMTREGKIVVDPVYTGVYALSETVHRTAHPLPALILCRANPQWGEPREGERYPVAAEDGSWITDFDFWQYTVRGDQVFLTGNQGCTLLDSRTGTRRDWTWEELGIGQDEVEQLYMELLVVYGLQWTDHGVYLGADRQYIGTGEETDLETLQVRILDPETGEVFWTGWPQWEEWLQDLSDQQWLGGDGWSWSWGVDALTLTRGEEIHQIQVPEADTRLSAAVEGNYVLANGETDGSSRSWLFRLDTGELLLQGASLSFLRDGRDPDQPPLLEERSDDGTLTLYTIGGADEFIPMWRIPVSRSDSWHYPEVWNGPILVKI